MDRYIARMTLGGPSHTSSSIYPATDAEAAVRGACKIAGAALDTYLVEVRRLNEEEPRTSAAIWRTYPGAHVDRLLGRLDDLWAKGRCAPAAHLAPAAQRAA